MASSATQDINQRLEKFTSLPSIPQIIVKIRQISEDPKSNVADLANCILSDHQLTSRILRMANSPYYGDFAGRVTTVTHAIVLMGFRAVRNIAISMSVYGVVNNLTKNTNFDITAFWTRSVACGVIAKYLAERIGQKELIEAAFIAGFMHDIGQVILAGLFPDDYGSVGKEELEAPNVHKTEKILLGMNHMEAGGLVARKWNLPETLIASITEHHRLGLRPDEKSSKLIVDLVFLSDRLYAHMMAGSKPDSEAYTQITNTANQLIGVSQQSMVELVEICREQIAEIAGDLDINIEKEFERASISVEEGADDIRQQLTNKEVQLAFLQNTTTALLEAKTIDEILQILCETVFRGLQMGRVLIFAFDKKKAAFNGRVGFGLESQDAVQQLSFPVDQGLFKHLCEKGKPLTVDSDAREIYRQIISQEEAERLETKAFAAIPIKVFDEVQYVIIADRPDKDTPIHDETLRSMTSIANQGALSIERQLYKASMRR
ncbi:MAG TPA: HDOD domain-containing protein [candidate division Zixibacteria bacterium]|nr:HDOD domain-containing protein [candidate division Zixibacteria bacterium]